MLPLVHLLRRSDGKSIGEPTRRRRGQSLQPCACGTASSRAHRADADNVLEHRTIPMPAHPGARVISCGQRLSQIFRGNMCEPCRLRAQRQQPRGYPDADDLDDLRGDPAFWGSNQSCACKERIARGVKCLPDRRRPEWLGNVIRVRQIGGKVREYDGDPCVQRSVRGDADHR